MKRVLFLLVGSVLCCTYWLSVTVFSHNERRATSSPSFQQPTLAPRPTHPVDQKVHRIPKHQCSSFKNCEECASDGFTDHCQWCVGSAVCMGAKEVAAECKDAEGVGECSLALLTSKGQPSHIKRPSGHKMPDLPHRFRVVYVGRRTGGPEALVQLHLALRHWGFNSTLESRKKQVGKHLLPYFLDTYDSEFKRHGVHFVKNNDYGSFVRSAAKGDVLVGTETWPCVTNLTFHQHKAGARQVTFQLTVQDKRLTYDISHVYIPSADPYACTQVAHSHYMANEFLNVSHNAVMTPFINPSIVSRSDKYHEAQKGSIVDATSRKRKKDKILFDGDAGMKTKDFVSQFHHRLVKAASLSPENLYKLFEDSVIAIDLGLPGSERLVMEAALFDVAIIIDDQMNGASPVDFPIPEHLRIPARDNRAMNKAIEVVLADPKAAVDAMLPFREYVRSLRGNFYRSVRQYFSDSIHVVIDAGCASDTKHEQIDPMTLIRQILSVLIHLPFATVEVFSPLGREQPDGSSTRVLPLHLEKILRETYFLSSVSFASCSGKYTPFLERPEVARPFFALTLKYGSLVVHRGLVRIVAPLWFTHTSGGESVLAFNLPEGSSVAESSTPVHQILSSIMIPEQLPVLVERGANLQALHLSQLCRCTTWRNLFNEDCASPLEKDEEISVQRGA